MSGRPARGATFLRGMPWSRPPRGSAQDGAERGLRIGWGSGRVMLWVVECGVAVPGQHTRGPGPCPREEAREASGGAELSNGPGRGYNPAARALRPALRSPHNCSEARRCIYGRTVLWFRCLWPPATGSTCCPEPGPVVAQSELRWELLLVNDGGPSPAGVVAGWATRASGWWSCASGAARATPSTRPLPAARRLHRPPGRRRRLASGASGRAAGRPGRGTRGAYGPLDAERVDLAPDGLGGWRETGRAGPPRSRQSGSIAGIQLRHGISVLHDRALFERPGHGRGLDVLLDWDLWRAWRR
jgi:hypothetical protein